MKKLLIMPAVLISLLVIVAILYKPASTPAIVHLPAPTQEIVQPDPNELFNLVNKERTKVGLNPLTLDVELTASSQAKCESTVQANVWAHDLPDGRNGLSFIEAQETNMVYWGENLAFDNNQTGPTVTVDSWMKSPGHRENILRPNFNHVGYAVCQTNNLANLGKGYLIIQHLTEEY